MKTQVRVGGIPHAIAVLRNTAIGLMRLNGESNTAAASRRLATQSHVALALTGVTPGY